MYFQEPQKPPGQVRYALEVLIRRSVPLQQITLHKVDRLLVRNTQAATLSSSTERQQPSTTPATYVPNPGSLLVSSTTSEDTSTSFPVPYTTPDAYQDLSKTSKYTPTSNTRQYTTPEALPKPSITSEYISIPEPTRVTTDFFDPTATSEYTSTSIPRPYTTPDAYHKPSATSKYIPTSSMTKPNNPVKPTVTSGGRGYGQTQPQTLSNSFTSSASRGSFDPTPTTELYASTSSAQPIDSKVAQVLSNFEKPDLQVQGAFRMSWYFIAMYGPSIVAVILKELWSLVACGLKMMEPFYSLSLAGGAAAKDSLMVNYLEPSSMFPFRQAIRGSVSMIAVIVGSLVVQLLAPIASESMTVVATLTNIYSNGRTERFNSAWALNLAFIRVLQAILSVISFFVLFMAFFGWKRHSPLTANPSMIATMASLLNHPGAVQDMNSINPSASNKRIAESIEHKRYILGDYLDAHGDWQYGLMRLVGGSLQDQHNSDGHGPPSQFTPTCPARAPKQRRNHRSASQTVFDILFISLILSLLGTIIAYRIDTSDSGFNTFFNSGKFGPKFILSLGASLVATTFDHLEREVRTTIPYRALATKHAPAQNSILRPADGTALSGLFQSLRHRSWFHAFIALTAVLGDVLIIAMAGVPFSESLSFLAYLTSTYLSISIIAMMLAAAISVFRWRITNKKLDLPSQPNGTMIRIWMACSNRDNQVRTMLGDLGGSGVKALRERCRREGGTYSAGWVVDEFGREVWRVDKD